MNKPTTKLEKYVLNAAKDSGYDTPESYLEDVTQYGCQSGMVSELIYYTDTVKFYKKFRKEIDALLIDLMDGIGANSPSDLFGDKWEKDDPFARDTMNQNLLAWFGFEEAANRLLND